jgi:hypothetical protein
VIQRLTASGHFSVTVEDAPFALLRFEG